VSLALFPGGRERGAGERPPHGTISLAFLVTFSLLAGFALASSLWLRAGPMEVGIAALERGDEAAVEALLEGALSRPVTAGRVGPLVDLALATGATDRAISILEEFVRTQPNHAGALRRLADVLDQARQNARLAVILERLHAVTGEVEHLRRASELYDSPAQRAARQRTLETLVRLGAAEAEETLTYAQNSAAAGDPRAGFQSVLAALRRDPGEFAMELLSLGAVLALELPDTLVALGHLGQAGAVAPTGLGQAAQALLDRDQPLAARALLGGLPAEMLDHPGLLLQTFQAEVRTDRALASQRLTRLRDAGRLPPAMLADLVLMEIDAGNLEAALTLAAAMPDELIPDWLPGLLLERLAGQGQLARLASVPLGPLARDPLLAAAAALERNAPREALPFARLAVEQPPEAPGQRLVLVNLLRRLDLVRPSLNAILEELRRGEGRPERLALLPLLADAPAQAQAAILALRPWRDRLAGAAAPWALLAAQHGQARDVLGWLSGAALPVEALLDIQAAGLVRRDEPLASAAGQAALRVAREGGGLPSGWTEAEVALRGALAGRLTEAVLLLALDQLPSAPPQRVERITQLLAAHPDLAAASRFNGRVSGHPALASLPRSSHATFLVGLLAPDQAADLAARAAAEPLRFGPVLVAARFRTAGEAAGVAALRDLLGRLPAESREAAVHVTISYAPGFAAAIERAAAESLGGNWAFNVLARLERGGQRGPLLVALRARAGDASLPRNERMAAAARLGELQDREGAVAAMRALAEGQPPDSAEVRQLIYLWGPAARPEALSWAERRAREAPPGQRAAWLAHLDYLGGTTQVLRLLGDWREALARDPALARTAATLFHRAGRGSNAEPLLAAAIQSAQDAATLGALGQAADAAALPRLALLAYGRALAQRPGEMAWRIAAARAAASAHRPEEAVQHYRALTSSGRATPELLLEAGDAMRATQQTAAARRSYSEALERTSDERLRARLLARLGRTAEAEALLTRLQRAAPDDLELRAELLELRVR
jgi:hypothetical protein